MKYYLLVLLFVSAYKSIKAFSLEERFFKETMDFLHECGSSALTLCLKEKTLQYIEKLPGNIDVGGGIKIKRNEVKRFSRQYSPGQVKEDIIDAILFEKIAEYFSTHTFEFQMPPEAVRDMQKTAEEGRKKKGDGNNSDKNKGMNPYYMMFQIKAVTLGIIAMKLIAMTALKALFIAKVAFTISSVIALKKLLESKHHTSTYEVLEHPAHVEDYGHYDRSFKQENAQQAQFKAQQFINNR